MDAGVFGALKPLFVDFGHLDGAIGIHVFGEVLTRQLEAVAPDAPAFVSFLNEFEMQFLVHARLVAVELLLFTDLPVVHCIGPKCILHLTFVEAQLSRVGSHRFYVPSPVDGPIRLVAFSGLVDRRVN